MSCDNLLHVYQFHFDAQTEETSTRINIANSENADTLMWIDLTVHRYLDHLLPAVIKNLSNFFLTMNWQATIEEVCTKAPRADPAV